MDKINRFKIEELFRQIDTYGCIISLPISDVKIYTMNVLSIKILIGKYIFCIEQFEENQYKLEKILESPITIKDIGDGQYLVHDEMINTLYLMQNYANKKRLETFHHIKQLSIKNFTNRLKLDKLLNRFKNKTD